LLRRKTHNINAVQHVNSQLCKVFSAAKVIIYMVLVKWQQQKQKQQQKQSKSKICNAWQSHQMHDSFRLPDAAHDHHTHITVASPCSQANRQSKQGIAELLGPLFTKLCMYAELTPFILLQLPDATKP
jgi:hypothetical protein